MREGRELPSHRRPLNRSLSAAAAPADSIMGVALFRDAAPRSFGLFDRALSSMFRLTAGETWVDELVLLDPDQGGWRDAESQGGSR